MNTKVNTTLLKDMDIPTIKELKELHIKARPNSVFFDNSNLKAFGESLYSMRVLKHIALVRDRFGFEHTCYIVSSKRFKNTTVFYYFDVDTLKVIEPVRY